MANTDPWEAAFAAYQKAMVDLDGDGVPDAVMRMPQGRTTSVPPQRMSDAARRRSTGEMGAIGTDPSADGGTMIDAAMFAAGPAGGAIGRLGKGAIAAGVAGVSGLWPSEANSQSSLRAAQQRQLEMEARRQQLETEAEQARQRSASEAERQRLDTEGKNQRLNQSAAAELELRKAEALATQERTRNQLLKEDNDNRDRENRNKTFTQKYPGVADALPGLGLITAAAVPAAGRVLSQRARNAPMREWNATVRETEDALANRDLIGRSRPDVQGAGDGLAKLDQFNASYPKGTLKPEPNLPLYQPSKGMVGAGMFGGSVAAESSMFPDQWNAVNLPDDNPEKAESRSRALNPLYYLERGAMGALTGSSGYKAGGMMYPDMRGPLESSKGLTTKYGTNPESVRNALLMDAETQRLLSAGGRAPSSPGAAAAPVQPGIAPAGAGGAAMPANQLPAVSGGPNPRGQFPLTIPEQNLLIQLLAKYRGGP